MQPIKNHNGGSDGYKTANNNWIDKKEVLENMGICSRTLQNWRSNGILPFYRMGGRIYYREGDLEKMMEMNKCVGIEKRRKQ